MTDRKPFKITDRLRSFTYAAVGIRVLLRTQHNAWIHLLATLVVLIGAFLFRISLVEWSLLILCIGFVWTAEAMNTAIEAVVDLASPDHHPLAKRAKDIAAGAVLLASTTAAIIGFIIFLPKVLKWLLDF